MMKNLLSVIALSFFGLILNAQKQSFTVSVSNDTVLLGNKFELRFEIKNLQGRFEAPNLSELNIISGPNVQSSMQFANGESMQSMSYIYIIKPEEIGALLIHPAYLEAGDGMETAPVEILVLPNPDGIIEESNFTNNDLQSIIPDFNFDFGFPDRLKRKKELPKDTVSKYKIKRI